MNEHTYPSTEISGWQDLTVGQMAARHPQSARVFETHGIDYCCGGKRSLREACEKLGLDLEMIRADLAEALRAAPLARETDWERATIAELIDHIQTDHHGFIRMEKPRLIALAHKVARVHGSRHPELEALAATVDDVFLELDPHLEKEERALFPAFRKWAQAAPGTPPDAAFAKHLKGLEEEHAGIGKMLETIQELTSGFQPPEDACNSYLALFHGLERLNADLHEHIHEENNILHARMARAVSAPIAPQSGPGPVTAIRNGDPAETCCGR